MYSATSEMAELPSSPALRNHDWSCIGSLVPALKCKYVGRAWNLFSHEHDILIGIFTTERQHFTFCILRLLFEGGVIFRSELPIVWRLFEGGV